MHPSVIHRSIFANCETAAALEERRTVDRSGPDHLPSASAISGVGYCEGRLSFGEPVRCLSELQRRKIDCVFARTFMVGIYLHPHFAGAVEGTMRSYRLCG